MHRDKADDDIAAGGTTADLALRRGGFFFDHAATRFR